MREDLATVRELEIDIDLAIEEAELDGMARAEAIKMVIRYLFRRLQG